jgi:hypothetical protein
MILLEVGVTPVKMESVFFIVFIIILTLVLRSFSNKPLIAPIWRVYKIFWLMLGIILFANFAKKSIKAWWEKD